MKVILIILFCLPMITSAQGLDSTKTIVDKYIVENKNVTYVSMFEVAGKSQKEIKDLMVNKIANDPRLSIIQSTILEDQISGSFKNLDIDFRKYGYHWGNVTVWLIHPMTADFTIQFKDNKYRVIIKNPKSIAAPQLELDLTAFIEKNGKLSTNKNCLRSYYAFGKTMDEMFSLNNYSKKDW